MHVLRHCLLTCSIAILLAAQASAAPPSSLAPVEGVLLLRSGGVLNGKITQVGDRYFVAVPGGEIRIKTSEVELYCQSLEEAYLAKRELVMPGQAGEHLDLAEWCLRNELHEQAAAELAAAGQADPRHPRLPLVDRRLKLALAPVETRPASAAPAPKTSEEELDRLTADLPAGTLEAFTQSVQPILLNLCNTSGCHGLGAKNALRLERSPGKLPATRRLTQRNLAAVLQYIDRDNPVASPLLTRPLAAHGTVKGPVFNQRLAHKHQQLAQWVAAVTKSEELAGPATIGPPALPLLQRMQDDGAAERFPADGESKTQAWPGTTSAPEATSAPDPRGKRRPERHFTPRRQLREQPQRGAEVKQQTAKDSFDPEIFNRQYSPQRSK